MKKIWLEISSKFCLVKGQVSKDIIFDLFIFYVFIGFIVDWKVFQSRFVLFLIARLLL